MTGTMDEELYWLVDDAEAAYRDMSARAEVSLPLKEMTFGKIFGVRDPAGQARYVIELSRSRPSRQVG